MKLMEEKQVERLYVPSPKWNRGVGLGGGVEHIRWTCTLIVRNS